MTCTDGQPTLIVDGSAAERSWELGQVDAGLR